MKKILCNTLIIIIMLGVFCNGYFGFSGLSFSDRVSYAEADNWSDCDTSDLVTAFRYYCKSRNLAIEGSIADALTSFTTNTFNNICSTLGIDPTSLSAELKKTTEGNLGLRFLFSNTGITAYNRIFSEFLQNNDLSVGDTNVNKNIYSGKYFITGDNQVVLIFISNTDSASNAQFDYVGTYLNPDGSTLYNMYLNGTRSVTYNFTNSVSRTYNLYYYTYVYGGYTYNTYSYANSNSNNPYKFYDINTSLSRINRAGGVAVHYNTSTQEYKAGYVSYRYYYLNSELNSYDYIFNIPITIDNAVDTNINIVSNNINNNTYNNNFTIIYNDGDTYVSDDDDEPLSTTPPGGGGNVDPDPDDPLDPYDPTKPFPDTPDNPTPDPGVHGSPGSDGTITIPDFNFDLPDINWSIDGLHHKFPFSLPFDLYNACKLLNAEPQTPELDYTVDLVVYQWPVQMDLHWLDPAARVIRIFELLAFVVGLILITRHLIGG